MQPNFKHSYTPVALHALRPAALPVRIFYTLFGEHQPFADRFNTSQFHPNPETSDTNFRIWLGAEVWTSV